MKGILFVHAMLFCLYSKAQQASPTKDIDSLFFHSNYKAALDGYNEYVKSNPAAPPYVFTRIGYCYHKLNNYTKALENYSAAMKKGPAQALKPYLYSRMAMTYSMKGDKANALVFIDSATANSYVNLFELENFPDFNSLRTDDHFKAVVEQVRGRVYPCLAIAATHDFDFWIGEWEVFNNQSPFPRVGTSVIESISGGCSILENWTAYNNPGNGKSFNYYDTTTKKWTQLWIGSGGGQQFYTDGEYKDGVMRFKYQSPGPNNKVATGNFYFYNLGPNKVRQYQDISTDGGKTFQVSYDFIYIRKGTKG